MDSRALQGFRVLQGFRAHLDLVASLDFQGKAAFQAIVAFQDSQDSLVFQGHSAFQDSLVFQDSLALVGLRVFRVLVGSLVTVVIIQAQVAHRGSLEQVVFRVLVATQGLVAIWVQAAFQVPLAFQAVGSRDSRAHQVFQAYRASQVFQACRDLAAHQELQDFLVRVAFQGSVGFQALTALTVHQASAAFQALQGSLGPVVCQARHQPM